MKDHSEGEGGGRWNYWFILKQDSWQEERIKVTPVASPYLPFQLQGIAPHTSTITHQWEGGFNQTCAPLRAELHQIRRTYCSITRLSLCHGNCSTGKSTLITAANSRENILFLYYSPSSATPIAVKVRAVLSELAPIWPSVPAAEQLRSRCPVPIRSKLPQIWRGNTNLVFPGAGSLSRNLHFAQPCSQHGLEVSLRIQSMWRHGCNWIICMLSRPIPLGIPIG